MPVVNYDRMFQAFKAAGGDFNQIVYWSGLFDWKNQVLTPNPDTIYVLPFFDTKEVGPVVIEIPPAGDDGSITGTIMDVWQAALEDVGPAPPTSSSIPRTMSRSMATAAPKKAMFTK
jgi:hypothetical protein